MPRRKLCQHPTSHTGSSYVPTGSRWISSRLLNFMRSRDDFEELNIHWLCPKCQRVETEMMKEQHPMVEEDDMNVSDDESSENNSTNNEGRDDENDSADDDENESEDDNEKGGEDDMLLELSYQEEQALEQLSAVFNLLKMRSIHDK